MMRDGERCLIPDRESTGLSIFLHEMPNIHTIIIPEKSLKGRQNYMNTRPLQLFIPLAAAMMVFIFVTQSWASEKYKGKAWHDSVQTIPGKIQCEYYDQGGEGIAYHDVDSVNNGSGKLNPANGTYLNEFRMGEGVDISYTKSNGTDDNKFNRVERSMGALYVGWTEPGEWINYTVHVKRSGSYTVAIMYTASGDGGIALDLDGKTLTQELKIPSTRSEQETTAWRQWHHWNRIDTLTTVNLKKGIHVLTLKTVTHGNMNYDYLEFTRVSQGQK
jgi:hypothetical protein